MSALDRRSAVVFDHLDPLAQEAQMSCLSSIRARLAGFDHAYAIATRMRIATGEGQYIVRTSNPMQPIRITQRPPDPDETLLATLL